jgi:hypothetical protein
MTEKSIVNISKALWAFQQNMPKVVKDKKAYGYKYADLKSIMDAALPILNRNGIIVVQKLGSSIENEADNISVCTTLIHVDSGETIESTISHPILINQGKTKQGKDQMTPIQAAGSVSTYLRRYAISAILGLVTEDDLDGNHPRGNDNGNGQQPKQQPQNQKQQMNDGYRNQQQQQQPGMMSDKQYKMICALANKAWTDENGNKLHYKEVSKKIHEVGERLMLSPTSKEWTIKDASAVIKEIQGIIDGNELPEGFGGY